MATAARPHPDTAWVKLARRARLLSWLSLLWMTLEGVAGLAAGLQANSISILTWAASSAVEGLASAIVIWRFTGARTLSEHAERRAQRWVAGSSAGSTQPRRPAKGRRTSSARDRPPPR